MLAQEYTFQKGRMLLAEYVARAILVAVGLVHLAPTAVALSVERTRTAYGVVVSGADLAVLLRHRAVLLALVGAGFIAGAFFPSVRVTTICAGVISMATFVAIAATSGQLNRQNRRVMWIDVAALAAIAFAVILLVIA
jgi:hypothetical protein